ncbi:pantoate--beta-alanine ligase [Arenibacter sp. ARW7G5Y1]|uniref:pantoate--beta-alanine ligase n=1 Tax=Arenibacter sp. ARW7G5Y1 TaxID=2135619 RepID=UPI000D753467|nr:pantoate--beta-alanine ligase [Arenibacter sp. ARW7G5Y1]PXX31497.1 pantoate--beta-alanine ligase [Arenibacter sp. ARW7G5Y1]
MQLINSQKELKSYLNSIQKTKSIGLVPTMGALHMGHMSLVQRSVGENDITVVSIFVNPTQFNNKEDLEKYPNTLEADLAILKGVTDRMVVFAPSAREMYSGDISSKSYNFEGLENVMEGEFREGHFDGVGTIVEKLLRLISPTRAYFGEKDFQQLQIIKKLVKITNLPIEIIGCPIVREANGLAMSSRNERLDPQLRQEASFIYKTLKAAKQKFGTKSANFTVDWVKKQFNAHPKLKLEYVKIADEDQLKPVKRKNKKTKYRAFIAVYAGDVRLIDNIAL